MKKIYGLVMSIILLMGVNCISLAETNEKNWSPENVFVEMKKEDPSLDGYDVEKIGSNPIDAGFLSSSNDEYAFVKKGREENIESVEVIVPYKMLEDGTLMNSFEYARIAETGGDDFNFIDVRVYMSGLFEHYNLMGVGHCYRPLKVHATWFGEGTVTNLNANYYIIGNERGLNSGVEHGRKSYNMPISVSYPGKGVTYTNSSTPVQAGNIIYFTGGDHGELNCTIQYLDANGNARTDSRAYGINAQ